MSQDVVEKSTLDQLTEQALGMKKRAIEILESLNDPTAIKAALHYLEAM